MNDSRPQEGQPPEGETAPAAKGMAGVPALLPCFATDRPNEAIVLYEGGLKVGGLPEGDGVVSLDWLPTPWMRFRVETSSPTPVDMTALPRGVTLKERQVETTGMLTGSELRVGTAGSTQVVQGILDTTSVGESAILERLLFHIPNLPTFVGNPIHRQDAGGFHGWTGRLEVDDGLWEVTLDPLEKHRELLRHLGSVGGYSLTTVGQVRRVDSGPFSMAESRELLESIRFFLSLLAGRWTDSVLRVGFSPDNRRVSEEWHSPSVDPWRGRRSVFPEYVREWNRVREPRLLAVFRALRGYWADPNWKDVVTWAISWLIESDKAVNADTSIVLSQAGLELLAWAQLVLRRKMSARKFEALEAHKALSDLLDAVCIPTRLPNGTMLEEMHDLASKCHVEGPEAFTRVRNAVVHPRRGERRPSPELRIEASQLGLWYLQLALLRLLDYEDEYLDRLRSWSSERVPWAS